MHIIKVIGKSQHCTKTLLYKKNRTKDLSGESNTIECAQAVLDNL